jgi:uncharacterized protein YyaL (SSP411 family)
LTLFVWAEHNHSNALIKEDSPYLQQHAHNPVNWYPWGEEAFEKAEKENKMIFLSIGYSTCHWCHVMEEDSFTDDKVAKLLNESFVSIKIDREEYPQLDKKYQKLYMSVHGKRGGWPLSVFLSPEREVFHLGTYIPKEEAYGSLGLMKLLPSFRKLQKEKREQCKMRLQAYKHAARKGDQKENLKQISSDQVIDQALAGISAEFDRENGGFATRPKFPEASKIALLLDIYRLKGDKQAFHMAEKTLKKMAEGGIYDQIGGGFFRYTTDEAWQRPHFEKMLYTNAELIPVYVTLYEMTGDRLYKKVVDETIAQMEKNFMEEGVYLSASDADSNGEEGGYFIYAYLKVKKDLLAGGMKLEDAEEALAYLGIEEDGNIDGDFSHTHIMSQHIPDKLEEVKAYLKGVNAKRTFPFVDRKIITAWNTMMIKALFSASRIDEKYLTLAQKRLDSLLKIMWKKDILYHQTLLGKEAKQKALLEDYAFLMDAMIEGYEKTYNKKYLLTLETLAEETLRQFYKNRQWVLSDDGIEAEADFDDRYYTSPLSVMLENLVRLSSLSESLGYSEIVQETIKNLGAVLQESPAKAPKLLHVFLRLELGDVIIKSIKEKLQKSRKEIEAMRYPFVLSKPEESDKYLACRVNSCFAYDVNITVLIEKIEKAVK